MTPCLFQWICAYPRDERQIPASAPHKIRLIRIEGVDPLEVLFETQLLTGSWVPPTDHTTPTKYRIEVCCSDPGYGECEWEVLAGIDMSRPATGCPTCTPIPYDFCKKVKIEGEIRQNLIIVVEIASTTLSCLCGGVSVTTPNWSGLYVLTPTYDGAKCFGQMTQSILGSTCTGPYTVDHSLAITTHNNTQTVVVRFGSVIRFGGGVLAGRYVEHTYVLGDTGLLLTPLYYDCEGMELGEKMDAGFDFSRSDAFVGLGLSDPGVCWYPTSYNPILSITRQ